MLGIFEIRTNDIYHLLTLLALETGQRAEALEYARAVHKEAEAAPGGWPKARDLLAIAYLKNGFRDTAYQLLNELKKDAPSPKKAGTPLIPIFTAGFLAYEEGNYQAAVENFEKAIKRPRIKAPLFHYGVSLLKIGRTDEAIKELNRVTWWVPPVTNRADVGLMILPTWTFWPVYAVKAHYWLGVAYEQKGDRAKAVQEYETFLDIWKNADPGIAEVEDAKQKLAELKKKG